MTALAGALTVVLIGLAITATILLMARYRKPQQTVDEPAEGQQIAAQTGYDPLPGGAYLAGGIAVTLVGFMFYAAEDGPTSVLTMVTLWAGSILTLIGIVAIGVRVGTVRADFELRRDGHR